MCHVTDCVSMSLLLQQPTLSDMTQYELNFSLLVEQMLSKITDPAYRQMIVEVVLFVLPSVLDISDYVQQCVCTV